MNGLHHDSLISIDGGGGGVGLSRPKVTGPYRYSLYNYVADGT